METDYTKADLERIIARMESRPSDGSKDRMNAIKEALDRMTVRELSIDSSIQISSEGSGEVSV